jgi:hypothetical protein
MIHPMVMWMDPGGDSGLAWLWDTGTRFHADEFRLPQLVYQIEDTCSRYRRYAAVGWERYFPIPGKPQTNAADAIEPIGVLKSAAIRYGCTILKPAEPRTPDASEHQQLEAIGWWVPGKDDAQSAAGHMLRYCRRSGNLPPAVAAILSGLPDTIKGRTGRRN